MSTTTPPAAVSSRNLADITKAFAGFRKENSDTRIRQAAAELGVSEAELVATGIDGDVVPLRAEPDAILCALEPLGEVMALTRNDACVHEKHGVYANVEIGAHASLVLNEAIDLRIFLAKWKLCFAVRTPWEGGVDGKRRSLQFFDAHGDAVHKVFMTRKSDVDGFESLVQKFAAPSSGELAVPVTPRATVAANGAGTKTASGDVDANLDVDVDAFLDAWAGLQDTHDFFPLLRKFNIHRTDAVRLADGRFTRRVADDSARRILEMARDEEVPIMVFVGNEGCIQIHSGPVKTLKEYGPWYNVLDPGFNLHLNESMVAESWVVTKPTEDGPVNALELFAADGSIIAQFFGLRKPGREELSSWRSILDRIPPAES